MATVYWPVSTIYLVISFTLESAALLMGYSTPAKDLRPKLVVAVSGCDSGFGRELAVKLARDEGYTVVAGCLNAESVAELEALKVRIKVIRSFRVNVGANVIVMNRHANTTAQVTSLHAAPLDVTNDESVAIFIASLAGVVNAPGTDHSLHAVVCNAGVASGGPIDWLQMKDFKMDMEVRRLLPGLARRVQTINSFTPHARIFLVLLECLIGMGSFFKKVFSGAGGGDR